MQKGAAVHYTGRKKKTALWLPFVTAARHECWMEPTTGLTHSVREAPPPLPPSPSSSSPSSSCSSSSSSSSPYSSFSSSALVRPEACSPTRHIISAGWSSPLSSLSGVPVGLFEWISCGSPERVAVCVCEGVKAADDSRQPQQGRRG